MRQQYRRLNSTEKRVARALFKLSRWASTNEVAKWADDMSWNTAEKILQDFHKMQIIQKMNRKERTYWKVREIS
jgi:hypothetical protein